MNSSDYRLIAGLLQLPQVGRLTVRKLFDYFKNLNDAVESPLSKIKKVPGISEKVAIAIKKGIKYDAADSELLWMNEHRVKAIAWYEEEYPSRLLEINDFPLILYIKGNWKINLTRSIAIVGTRTPSNEGREICQKLINDLSEYNCTIISGLANGIDTVAHKISLQNKLNTIAILGSGLNSIYPSENHVLANSIIESGGSLITEYMHFEYPDRNHFPERNRIVAGMCDATVVIETGKKGGSMITANLAFQYNRDVYAFPGRPGDSRVTGCNHLIKNHKAALIENGEDLLYHLGWEVSKKNKDDAEQMELFISLTGMHLAIYKYIKSSGKTSIDQICVGVKMAQHQASYILIDLEIQGYIKSLPGKLFEIQTVAMR